MADEKDTFYDHVDARRGGSLVEEEIPEFICNEFFKTHSDVETITLAVPKVKTSVENENERVTQSSSSEPLQRELSAAPQVVHKVISSSESDVPQHPVQDENIAQEPAETKPAANLEDLSRLAMFGKQRKVLRRSQIRPEPVAAAAAPSPASNTQSSRRSTQRETPRSRLHPTPVNSVRSSGTQRDDSMLSARARFTPSSIREKRTATRSTTGLGKNKPGPVRVLPESKQGAITALGGSSQPAVAEAGSVTCQTSDVPQGPLTRARCKGLGLSAETGTTAKADAVSSDTVASLATGVRQMRVGAERVARDRAPRTTTSSASVVRAQRADPVRIGQRPQGGDFLRNAAVPTEREFRRELVNRVSSLGPNPRGSTSTPKDGEKAPSSVSSGTTNKDQRPPSSGGAAPVGRSLSATRSMSNVPRPGVVARSSSSSRPVNRPTVRPPSVTRPLYPTTLARPSSVTRPQSAASVKHPTPRTGSVTRTTHRPPSVTRPIIPDKPSNQQISSRAGVVNSTRQSTARVPVTVTAAARSIVGGKPQKTPVSLQRASTRTFGVPVTPSQGTPLRNPVHRNEQPQPLEPRSSVIRCTPVVPVGRGNGTPLRGFRSELRRYPAPTGLTPSHRAPTVPKGFGLHGKSACANGPNKTVSTTSSVGPSPMKTLSKEEERAMVNRLAVPKKIAMKTPSKVGNLQTHGLSCIKLRSRSTSIARRPTSALSSDDAPSSCRMLTYSGTDRPMSADPSTQTEPATAQETTTVE